LLKLFWEDTFQEFRPLHRMNKCPSANSRGSEDSSRGCSHWSAPEGAGTKTCLSASCVISEACLPGLLTRPRRRPVCFAADPRKGTYLNRPLPRSAPNGWKCVGRAPRSGLQTSTDANLGPASHEK
jgi:hypothetical protein